MIDDDEAPRASDAQLTQLATELLAHVEGYGGELADVVRGRVPFYRDVGIVEFAQLELSCVANLRYVFEAIARSAPADPAAARATGADRAAGGVPLPAVLAAYRVAMHYMWERVVEEARRMAIGADAVLEATRQGMIAHDLFTHEMAAAYNEQLTARIVAQETERAALVEAILTATITERRTIWEAADLLGLPTTGPYVVVAAELGRPGTTALVDITTVLARRQIRSAWRLLPDLQVGVVAVGTVEDLVPLLESPAGRVGISPVFQDLVDAPAGLDQARLAVASSSVNKGVTLFTDNPIGIAAVSSPAIIASAVDGILAPLDRLPASERATLIETLNTWIDAGGSSTKAAARLFCHPNTIRYRLRRVEELTGRRLHRPADAAAICLALNVLATQGR